MKRAALAQGWGRAVVAAGLALGALAAGQADARTPGRAQALTYVVSPGESLFDIGHRLLGGRHAWKRLQRWNGLRDPHRLQPGQRLVLPLVALRGRASLSQVLQVRGTATGALCGQAAAAAVLRVGQYLPEGSCIETAAQASLALALPDGSRLQLFPATRLQLVRTQHGGQDPRRWVELRLEQGRAETQAPAAPGLLRIGTPLGTAAVRGTTFGVEVQAARVLVDVTEGVVDVRPAFARSSEPVHAGEGATLLPGQGVYVAALPPPPPAPHEEAQSLLLRDSRSAPVLSFGPVAAAAGYRFVVTQQDAEAAVMDSGEVLHPTVPLQALRDGAYTVQMRAVGTQGQPGQAAQHRLLLLEVPDPPVLHSPPDGAVVPYGPLALRCRAGPVGRLAELFEFELARDPGFTHRLEVQRRERCALDTSVPGGTVYWRVRALGAPHGSLVRAGAFSQAGVIHAEAEVSAPQPAVAPGPALDDADAAGPGRR